MLSPSRYMFAVNLWSGGKSSGKLVNSKAKNRHLAGSLLFDCLCIHLLTARAVV